MNFCSAQWGNAVTPRLGSRYGNVCLRCCASGHHLSRLCGQRRSSLAPLGCNAFFVSFKFVCVPMCPTSFPRHDLCPSCVFISIPLVREGIDSFVTGGGLRAVSVVSCVTGTCISVGTEPQNYQGNSVSQAAKA